LSVANPRWAARLRSASAKGAHFWLTTMPTSKDLVMRDDAYKTAVRYRLGIPPYRRAPRCYYCRGAPAMADDPWHPLHCAFQASHGKTVQHNLVRDKIRDFCHLAGFGNAITECKAYLPTAHAQPDVVVTFDNDIHAIDVSGTDPCAPSYVAAAARHTLHAAGSREREKNAHYSALVRLPGVQFFPFVFETLGGLSERAIEFVDKLSMHARARPGAVAVGSFKYHLLSAISVIIQTCNANLVNDAYVHCQELQSIHPPATRPYRNAGQPVVLPSFGHRPAAVPSTSAAVTFITAAIASATPAAAPGLHGATTAA